MTGKTGKSTSNNGSIFEQTDKLNPGTEQCELSEKTHQIGSDSTSEQMDKLHPGTEHCELSEKTHQIGSDSTSEQMDKLHPETEQCELSEKTHQIGSDCLDTEQRVLGTVLTSFDIDEKSNQISDIMTENSDIQLSGPPQSDLEKSCQTGEGSCPQRSTFEQVSGYLSNDKPENNCQPTSQNEPAEISDAVTSFIIEDQTQPLLAQVNKPENKCQPASQSVQNEPAEISDALTSFLVEDQTQSVPAQVSKPENKCQPTSQNVQNEPAEIDDRVTSFLIEDQTRPVPAQVNKPENKCQPTSQNVQNEPAEISDAVASFHVEDQTVSVLAQVNTPENKCQPTSQNVQNEPTAINDAVSSFLVEDQTHLVPAQVNMTSVNELLDPPYGDIAKNVSSGYLEEKSKMAIQKRLGHKDKKNSKLLKKKYLLRSLGRSDRALRSRTQEKPKAPESNSNLVDVNNGGEKRRRGRKKKKRRGAGMIDEFSRIRARLRYLLNRVSYEQSLIDAYSGEGWKGHSMEKLRPEKELQRAKSEILRRKLKIRDLFRNLDSLCTEGRLPESLFDSEGEIDSEDIFCAKCGSKELSSDNDIILCDGACDRGFHQFCLDPPLLTENIPPGDEGWLCPGCDCKDDCIELLNDSLGTSLSISDTWERVFPEAAAALGNNVDHNLGLPSDDSDDDDDYNPNVPEDEEGEGGESSSDESEYASASEKLEGSCSEDPILGLPSEDSEDDDYDPNAPDLDRRETEESSSSDFTSDSEDLAAIKDNESSGQDENVMSASLDDVKHFKGSSRQKCKVGKKPSIAEELSSLLEADPGQEGSTPVSGKRHVERLDYKKLYDETYPNIQSDGSDDEDWTDITTPSRKKKLMGKVASVSPNGKASSDKKPRSSTYRRLGEAVVQRLYKSFKENQYPDRSTKESLAQELGLTSRQVSKWFENTRWSSRHSSHMETSMGGNASQQATDSRAKNKGALGGEERDCELMSEEDGEQQSKSPSSRKRKHVSESLATEAHVDVDSTATMPPAGSPGTREKQTGHKMKTRKRK